MFLFSLSSRGGTPREKYYQLALTTPGTSPASARSRKQIRQIPNLRKYARERPHLLQRVYPRTLNFGTRFDFAIQDFFATFPPSVR
jgi:hypothetical protein